MTEYHTACPIIPNPFIPVSQYSSKLIPCFILDNFIDINGALK
jgi:hypothetical protein